MTDRVHWTEHPGRGPVLLLVHGFLSSSAQWLPNLGALGEVCRPVTLDLWGHGNSPSPSSPAAYSVDAYIAQLDTIRATLGVERLFLCGYSLGAGITIGYTLANPARMYGHVFTNSSSGLADAETIAAWQRISGTAAERIRTGGIKAIEAIPVHPRHATRLPKDVHDALLRDAARVSPDGVANTLLYTNPGVSMRARLNENTVPALLAFGRHEERFRDKRDYAARVMPMLEIVELDAGHGVNMEDATGFNRAVTAFIRKCCAKGSDP